MTLKVLPVAPPGRPPPGSEEVPPPAGASPDALTAGQAYRPADPPAGIPRRAERAEARDARSLAAVADGVSRCVVPLGHRERRMLRARALESGYRHGTRLYLSSYVRDMALGHVPRSLRDVQVLHGILRLRLLLCSHEARSGPGALRAGGNRRRLDRLVRVLHERLRDAPRSPTPPRLRFPTRWEDRPCSLHVRIPRRGMTRIRNRARRDGFVRGSRILLGHWLRACALESPLRVLFGRDLHRRLLRVEAAWTRAGSDDGERQEEFLQLLCAMEERVGDSGRS